MSEAFFIWDHHMFIFGISNPLQLWITLIGLGIILCTLIYFRHNEQRRPPAGLPYNLILASLAIVSIILTYGSIGVVLGSLGMDIQFHPTGAFLRLEPWIGFHVALILLLAIELIYARRQNRLGRDPKHTAIAATTLWIAAALAFAAYLRHALGTPSAIQYLAGYTLEESLSVDNLLVFLLLFRLFQIDRVRQPKVLFWGVAGAIVMRGLFIAGGLKLLARFEWVTYLFALILLAAAVRVFIPEKPGEHLVEPRWISWLKRWHPISPRQDHFIVLEPVPGRKTLRPTATMLLLALIAIELTDVVFALDSIPAVLSITRHPFLAYTSNIMAVMGLRSLYFLLIGLLTRLRFLHFGLAVILAFAAFKMLASRWIEVGPVASLAVILAVLALTTAASLAWQKPSLAGGPQT
jgi:tellurite resistance protein TerC